jgi:hypothetical protein
MSLAIDLFKIASEALGALLKIERVQRFEVSEHFANLARAFKAFPSAHRSRDQDQIDFLVGKTVGLIEALQGTGIFLTVLGQQRENEFFSAMREVLNLKELMAKGQYGESAAAYSEIMGIAGYFEGYAESLKAQARQH